MQGNYNVDITCRLYCLELQQIQVTTFKQFVNPIIAHCFTPLLHVAVFVVKLATN